jgi:hypothetical protein
MRAHPLVKKVVAFDLAALCLTIEGATRIPSFLVHDSPREADLGGSIYGRLFRRITSLSVHSYDDHRSSSEIQGVAVSQT